MMRFRSVEMSVLGGQLWEHRSRKKLFNSDDYFRRMKSG